MKKVIQRKETRKGYWIDTKKTYIKRPKLKKSSHMRELEDVDKEGGIWEQNNSWLEKMEDDIFNPEDREEEISDDPISSEEEKESNYEFDKDEESNIWLADIFKEAGDM